jgi:DNA-binding MarR family transcriptional regulator
MKDLLKRCKRYINDKLGIQATFSKHKKTGSLPFFLNDQYDFYRLNLLEKEFAVLAAKNNDDLTPAKIQKHIQIVSEKLQLQAIFLGQSLSSFNRQRLIAYKVPFIIPDNQMYLPDLAIDLKEHFVKARSKIKSLGPAAQVVVLYLLLNPDVDAMTPKELADRVDYSTMTMSRAVDEIEAAGLADVSLDGKRRVAQFDKNRRQLWETALPYLKTPVIKRLWVDGSKNIDLLTAGESALAKYSMLTPPKRPIYAISSKGWKLLKAEISVEGSLYIEEAQFQLEIWRYEPQILAEQETVDPFSLYLSLKETQDERIEAALVEMMEKKVQW